MSQMLGIKPKKGASVHDQLSSFLKGLKKGYTGRSERCCLAGKFDLSNDASNAFGINSRVYGGKEYFQTSSLDSVSVKCYEPCYFADIMCQIEMVRVLTGSWARVHVDSLMTQQHIVKPYGFHGIIGRCCVRGSSM